MSSVGYTAGQTDSAEIVWGKCLGKNNSDEQAYKISCMFAYIWQEGLKVLPQGVIDDYEAASEKLGGIRIDAGMMGKGEPSLRFRMAYDGVEEE